MKNRVLIYSKKTGRVLDNVSYIEYGEDGTMYGVDEKTNSRLPFSSEYKPGVYIMTDLQIDKYDSNKSWVIDSNHNLIESCIFNDEDYIIDEFDFPL